MRYFTTSQERRCATRSRTDQHDLGEEKDWITCRNALKVFKSSSTATLTKLNFSVRLGQKEGVEDMAYRSACVVKDPNK